MNRRDRRSGDGSKQRLLHLHLMKMKEKKETEFFPIFLLFHSISLTLSVSLQKILFLNNYYCSAQGYSDVVNDWRRGSWIRTMMQTQMLGDRLISYGDKFVPKNSIITKHHTIKYYTARAVFHYVVVTNTYVIPMMMMIII